MTMIDCNQGLIVIETFAPHNTFQDELHIDINPAIFDTLYPTRYVDHIDKKLPNMYPIVL